MAERKLSVVREDFIDYPTGFQIQDEIGTSSPPHDPHCSCVEGWNPISGPGFLCDCEAVPTEWRFRVATQMVARGEDPSEADKRAAKYLTGE